MYECLPARCQMGQRSSNVNDLFKADNNIRIQTPIFWLIICFFLPFLLPTHLPILNPPKCYVHLTPEIRGPLWQECSSPQGHNYPLSLGVDLGFLFILAAESISVRAQPSQSAATPEAYHAASWALSPVSLLWHLPLLCLPVSPALFCSFFFLFMFHLSVVSQLSHIASIKTTQTVKQLILHNYQLWGLREWMTQDDPNVQKFTRRIHRTHAKPLHSQLWFITVEGCRWKPARGQGV